MATTSLQGKVCIVTGASGGIGLATTKALLAEGAKVVLVARTESKLKDAEKSLKPARGTTLVVPADVSKSAQVKEVVRKTLETYGQVDVLVNAAGAFFLSPITEMTDEMWDKMMDGNLKGTFLMCREVVGPMLKAGKGDIVNVGSIAGHQNFGTASAYCASKWGLRGFTGSLASEIRKKGVRVTMVTPGSTDTSLWDPIGGPDRKRMLKPEDVADMVVASLKLSATGSVDEVIVMPRDGVL